MERSSWRRYNFTVNLGTRRGIAFVVSVIAVGLAVSFMYQKWKNRPVPFVDVYDGFETPRLSELWATDRLAHGAVTMQSDVVLEAIAPRESSSTMATSSSAVSMAARIRSATSWLKPSPSTPWRT